MQRNFLSHSISHYSFTQQIIIEGILCHLLVKTSTEGTSIFFSQNMWKLTVHIGRNHEAFQFTGYEMTTSPELIYYHHVIRGHSTLNILKTVITFLDLDGMNTTIWSKLVRWQFLLFLEATILISYYYCDVKNSFIECLYVVDISLEQPHEIVLLSLFHRWSKWGTMWCNEEHCTGSKSGIKPREVWFIHHSFSAMLQRSWLVGLVIFVIN